MGGNCARGESTFCLRTLAGPLPPWSGLWPQPKELGPKKTKKAEKKEQSEQACFFPFLLRFFVSFGK
jgi:hypothetical protein